VKRCCASLLILAALAVAAELRAQVEQPVSVCIGRIEYQGLNKKMRRTMHRKLVEQLLALGADIPAEAHGIELERSCFDDPACVQEAMSDIEVDGVLQIRAMRVGPLVRIDLGFFDASSGENVFSSEFTAPTRKFPGAVSFDADLSQGLESLRRLKPPPEPDATGGTSQATATEAAASPPPPPPPPPPEPEPAAEVDSSVWPVIGWSSLGFGVALLAGGAVTGGLAIAQDQELRSSCVDGQCPPQMEDDLAQLNVLTAVTDGLLVAGGVCAVAGAVVLALHLVGDSDE